MSLYARDGGAGESGGRVLSALHGGRWPPRVGTSMSQASRPGADSAARSRTHAQPVLRRSPRVTQGASSSSQSSSTKAAPKMPTHPKRPAQTPSFRTRRVRGGRAAQQHARDSVQPNAVGASADDGEDSVAPATRHGGTLTLA